MLSQMKSFLKKLYQKAQKGVSVRVRHDHKSGSTPLQIPIVATPVKAKGLMHRKIITTDDAHVFIGSANMTTSSLVLHDNLSVGFYHPPLARFLNNPTSSYFDLENRSCRIWLLPDLGALDYLIEQLDQAQSSIFVAMFTLTHPQLLEALASAVKRGVHVTLRSITMPLAELAKKPSSFCKTKKSPSPFSQGPSVTPP